MCVARFHFYRCIKFFKFPDPYAVYEYTSRIQVIQTIIANDLYINNLFGDDDAIICIAIAIAAIVVHMVVKVMVILNVKRIVIGGSTAGSTTAAVAIWDVIVIIGIIAWDHRSVICPFRLFAIDIGLIVIIGGLCGPTFRYTWSLMRLIWRFVIL